LKNISTGSHPVNIFDWRKVKGLKNEYVPNFLSTIKLLLRRTLVLQQFYSTMNCAALHSGIKNKIIHHPIRRPGGRGQLKQILNLRKIFK